MNRAQRRKIQKKTEARNVPEDDLIEFGFYSKQLLDAGFPNTPLKKLYEADPHNSAASFKKFYEEQCPGGKTYDEWVDENKK